MLSKLCPIFTMFLIISQISLFQQQCLKRRIKLKSSIRGNYQNVLKQNFGVLISSKRQNTFSGLNNGCCLRDEIYLISGSFGFVWCGIGYSIQLDLIQNYELNTLKLWFYNRDNRLYRLHIYINFQNTETKIYESNSAQSIVTITFPDQQVNSFRIYNYNGNTINSGLHVIKAEAYYKLQTTISR